MTRLSVAAYFAASARFFGDGGHPEMSLVALILVGWLLVLGVFIRRLGPSLFDRPVDGWTGSLSRSSFEAIDSMQGLSITLSRMSIGLTFFGPLLASWAFLP